MVTSQGTGATAANAGSPSPIRVMVVDDSAVVRGLETRMLESDPSIRVASSVANGQAALRALERTDIDIVVLDIEMPIMDGLTALPKILEMKPGVRVLISSTLTQKNADISIRAMSLGAADYIPKPSSSRELAGAGDFRIQLVEKVKALANASRRRSASPVARAAAPKKDSLLSPTAPLKIRAPGRESPQILAIGSSTGGPQALFNVLSGLKKAGGVQQPVLITQHMPASFTTILAEHITRIAGLPAKEAANGEEIEGGRVYVAPGDYHMLVQLEGGKKVFHLTQDPPENFCRPAVDPMFRSAVAAYGAAILACVLTGMGADGAKGAKVVAEAGGTVVAQDEETSVVWGMPGATAQSGVCSAVLPIDEIADYIHTFATRRA